MFDEAWLEDLRIQTLHCRERAPWLGGDLQTVAHRITYRDRPIPGIETPMQFPLRDGSGDIMTGTLHDPGKGGPLVILLHGVAGCEDSIYIKESARHLVEQGRRVLRLNHRGAGSSLASCSVTYQCAGTAEIIDVLDTLSDGLTGQGIFLCGLGSCSSAGRGNWGHDIKLGSCSGAGRRGWGHVPVCDWEAWVKCSSEGRVKLEEAVSLECFFLEKLLNFTSENRVPLTDVQSAPND